MKIQEVAQSWADEKNLNLSCPKSELKVLSAFLLEKNDAQLSMIFDKLKESDFTKPEHSLVLRVGKNCFKNSIVMCPETLLFHCEKEDQLRADMDKVKGLIAILSELKCVSFPTYDLVNILLDYSFRRKTSKLLKDYSVFLKNKSNDAKKMLPELISELCKRPQGNGVELHEQLQEWLENLDAKCKNDGIIGIRSGLADLDRLTGGFRKKQLIVVGGASGMGKSALLLKIFFESIKNGDTPVYFSFEMDSDEVLDRLVSMKTKIPHHNFHSGKLEDAHWEQLFHETTFLQETKGKIYDNFRGGLDELSSCIRSLKIQRDVKVVIIDYLQIMPSPLQKKTFNKTEEIALITRELKLIASQNDITIIVGSQLNRNIDNRTGEKRPTLADLRDSGTIGQDANMVLFIYRPAYYGITCDDEGEVIDETYAEVILAKNRSGRIGKIPAFFDKNTVSFHNFAK